MKNILSIVLMTMTLVTVNARAERPHVTDGDLIPNCGGYVLTQMTDGRISLKFDGYINPSCTNLSFYDFSSGKLIKSYDSADLSGNTYTLSNEQMSAISSDCTITWKLQTWNGYTMDRFTTRINGCRKHKQAPVYSRYYYEWSNKHNCKLMQNGEFVRLVEDYNCR